MQGHLCPLPNERVCHLSFSSSTMPWLRFLRNRRLARVWAPCTRGCFDVINCVGGCNKFCNSCPHMTKFKNAFLHLHLMPRSLFLHHGEHECEIGVFSPPKHRTCLLAGLIRHTRQFIHLSRADLAIARSFDLIHQPLDNVCLPTNLATEMEMVPRTCTYVYKTQECVPAFTSHAEKPISAAWGARMCTRISLFLIQTQNMCFGWCNRTHVAVNARHHTQASSLQGVLI